MKNRAYLLFGIGCFVVGIVICLMLSGCEDAKRLPGTPDDDDEIVSSASQATYQTIAGHGILWKPVADSGGKLVVLLNRSYGRPVVKIKNRRNQVIGNGRFVYYSNPDRATYRFDKPGRYYGSCYLVVGSRVFYVPNGGRRYE